MSRTGNNRHHDNDDQQLSPQGELKRYRVDTSYLIGDIEDILVNGPSIVIKSRC